MRQAEHAIGRGARYTYQRCEVGDLLALPHLISPLLLQLLLIAFSLSVLTSPIAGPVLLFFSFFFV
jgi:hypothetical protein